MKKLLFIIIIYPLFFTNVTGANASCTGGKCEFNNSIHYKTATTYCMQTLNYEEVETDFQNFTILNTGEVCEVLESNQIILDVQIN
tara:strand:+ start:193 stop:450 length:258 start_codon:yes stop_codon:yes gene_type:complete